MFFLRFYFWIAPHVLLAGVLFEILRRRLHKQFPLFAAYVAFEILQFLVLFSLNSATFVSRNDYYWVFTVGFWISTALRFGVIYELVLTIFRSHSTLGSVSRPLLQWLGIGLVFVSAVLTGTISGSGTDRIRTIFSVLDFSLSVIQCGLLLGLLLFSRLLNISWRNFAAGLALGFGIFASVELASSAFRAEFSRS